MLLDALPETPGGKVDRRALPDPGTDAPAEPTAEHRPANEIEESIAAARVLRPDLILMDVNLPGIDGMEATRRLREDTTAAAIVLLSTYDEDDWDGQAQECGAVAYVAKSAFGPDRLTAVWAVTGS